MAQNNGWEGTGYEDTLYRLAMEEREAPRMGTKKRRGWSKPMRILAAALAVSTSAGAAFGAGISIGGAAPRGMETAAVKEAKADSVATAVEAAANMGLILAAEADETLQSAYAPIALLTQTGTATVADIFKAVKDTVVSINTTTQVTNIFNRTQSYPSAGSGIIFREDADKIYIVTNFHVIENATQVTISLDDEITAPANLVGTNEEADIAVISVLKTSLAAAGITNYKIASFASSAKVEVGDAAIAIGNALGEGKSATLGIISAINKNIATDSTKLESVLQTDAAINAGNSGGALVNANGQVIGINTAKLKDIGVEGMGYAIPSDIVGKIIEQIMNGSGEKKPYLGISGATITDQHQRIYGFITKGVYVNGVEANSTAAAAGLRQGDIITAVNGQAITSTEQLAELEAKTAVGAALNLTIVRGNRETLTLTAAMKAYVGKTSF